MSAAEVLVGKLAPPSEGELEPDFETQDEVAAAQAAA